MAGRTGIAKKGKLYGDWGMSDMEQGIDEAQASGAAALAEKPKYKGWKSDLAFIEAQKKKKLAAKEAREKKAKYDPNRDKTKKISKRGGKDTTGYAVVQGGSPEAEKYGLPLKKKKTANKKKKRIGRTMY